jgi:hypothetical protein
MSASEFVSMLTFQKKRIHMMNFKECSFSNLLFLFLFICIDSWYYNEFFANMCLFMMSPIKYAYYPFFVLVCTVQKCMSYQEYQMIYMYINIPVYHFNLTFEFFFQKNKIVFLSLKCLHQNLNMCLFMMSPIKYAYYPFFVLVCTVQKR